MKTICIDFDGVLHSYTSGWQDAAIANDPPVPGAISWLRALLHDADFEPVIYSSRSQQLGGIQCMRGWLLTHGMTEGEIARLQFPHMKPAAWLTIDDRAICFDGTFPTLQSMREFKPWNKPDLGEANTPEPAAPTRRPILNIALGLAAFAIAGIALAVFPWLVSTAVLSAFGQSTDEPPAAEWLVGIVIIAGSLFVYFAIRILLEVARETGEELVDWWGARRPGDRSS